MTMLRKHVGRDSFLSVGVRRLHLAQVVGVIWENQRPSIKLRALLHPCSSSVIPGHPSISLSEYLYLHQKQ